MKSIIILYSILILCGSTASGNNNEAREQQQAARQSFRVLKQLPPPILEELGFFLVTGKVSLFIVGS